MRDDLTEEWAGFTEALALTLSELSERSVLMVSWASVPTVYVQFHQSVAALTARTGGDDVAPGSAGTVDLAAEGWQVPSRDPLGQRTWHRTLAWPVRSDGYRALSRSCVVVLRDRHGVPAPADLEYRAWREAELPPEGVTFYEDELEPAEPHLIMERLTIPDANAVPVDD